ncbi:uncharacterized protein EV154DRAFT_487246 [Mucor mucedo]|uniref:uncharacterized protein n=1 Tax=Mucor mucedo TaxID=29922 RepID=UPI00221F4381|nr:uncharacterized protein EV154DRAFT_487246 [Mucor mucedo]KAI7873372.1 hypothetical protein EV154DRAFT_487246 [Mucor mucedo]
MPVAFDVDMNNNEEVEFKHCDSNIDGLITNCTKEVPLVKTCRFASDLCPSAKQYGITRTDLGNLEREGTRRSVKCIPHTLFGVVNSEARVVSHILFPEMIAKDKEVAEPKKMSAFLSEDEQRKFVDELLIPALRKALKLSVFNRLNKSYKESVLRGKRQDAKNLVSGKDIPLIIQSLRDLVEKNLSLSQYRDFYFITPSFGFKQEFEGCSCQEILSTIIDWSKVSLKNTKVDLGINFATTALSGEPMISFARSGAINSIGYTFGGQNTKSELMPMALAGFGGLTATNKFRTSDQCCKLIVYNDIKIPFLFDPSGFNGSVPDRWEANQVRAGLRQENGKYLKNMEWYQTRLRESEMEQFTLRGYSWWLWGAHICHQEYLNYISCRLAFLNELAFKFEGKQNLRSLSCVAMVSLLLNSLMHPGNSSRTDAKNFVKARRSQNSCLLFLKDAFVLLEGEVEFDDVFERTRLQKQFYDINVIADVVEPEATSFGLEMVIPTGRPGNLTTRAYGQIKSPELQEAGRSWVWGETFLDVGRLNLRDLHLHDTSKRITMEKYAPAKSVMVMYGLGFDGALRFFEIFWKEYFEVLPKGSFQPELLFVATIRLNQLFVFLTVGIEGLKAETFFFQK